MPLYRPSELRQLLDTLGTKPKKSLSQNFLLDGNIIKKILKTADVSQGDLVLEIGPGPGALTEALLNAGATVFAIEKDEIYATALAQLDPQGQRLKIFCEDIMNLNLAKVFGPETKSVKVIANLPYHLTSSIITEFVPHFPLFSILVVMVQEEVARRFSSPPGNKMYGSITLFLNFYSHVEYAFRVSKNCFYPKPKVDSAIIKLTLNSPPNKIDEKKFFEFTRASFSHRRKMLRNSLEELFDSEVIQNGLKQIGKSIDSRAEQLSLEDFLMLYAILEKEKFL